MTIDEMIAEFQRRREMHGGAMEVKTTWEGVVRDIDLDNIYCAADGYDEDKTLTLWIDADYNSYKPKDAI
jgi:hypothetical protein